MSKRHHRPVSNKMYRYQCAYRMGGKHLLAAWCMQTDSKCNDIYETRGKSGESLRLSQLTEIRSHGRRTLNWLRNSTDPSMTTSIWWIHRLSTYLFWRYRKIWLMGRVMIFWSFFLEIMAPTEELTRKLQSRPAVGSNCYVGSRRPHHHILQRDAMLTQFSNTPVWSELILDFLQYRTLTLCILLVSLLARIIVLGRNLRSCGEASRRTLGRRATMGAVTERLG